MQHRWCGTDLLYDTLPMGTPCRNFPAGRFDCLVVREGQVPKQATVRPASRRLEVQGKPAG